MRFDDRLATVLRKPVTGDAIARIQYRQLLDLLGTSPTGAQGPEIDAAYLKLAELSRGIPAPVRAGMLGESNVRLRSPRLVSQLAAAEPAVAAAAIGAAELTELQWLDLVPALAGGARTFLRDRRDLGPRVDGLIDRLGIRGRTLPAADAPAEPAPVPEPPTLELRSETPAPAPIEGIGAIVRRIEQFRRTRQLQEEEAVSGDAPRLPLEDTHDAAGGERAESFDFATDADGRIVWTDPGIAPMAVGLRFAARDPESPAQASRAIVGAFRRRQPIRAELLTIAGAPAIAGDWQADAAPRFEQPGGRFVGYSGRLRRPVAADDAAVPATPAEHDSTGDRMRQILHELRTPVNAIQGFAEVIQQQLFGPTPHEYRALAATIASDAARMLAGFEELDRLARLEAGALELDPGHCEFGAVVAMTVAQLESYGAQRKSGFLLEQPAGALPVTMAREEAERLVWRLLATLAGAASPGERLKLRLRQTRDGGARMTVRLPASLAFRDDHALFHATASPQQPALAAGMFGTGFALRLAAAEAEAAGGGLERRDDRLRLSLPGHTRPDLTRSVRGHSQAGDAAANLPGGA